MIAVDMKSALIVLISLLRFLINITPIIFRLSV